MGWTFLIFGVATTALMYIALYPVVGFLPFSQFISPIVFAIAALSYAVLLGIVYIPAIVPWNVAVFNALVDIGVVTANLILLASIVVVWVLSMGIANQARP
jgi:hypothetical protein